MEKVIVVASTHWDREWYRTFSEFQIRLWELFDQVLVLLEENKIPSYTFDGQVVVLEDYLEVRPENRPRIQKLVAEKRLFFGPLYNLPDEFLSGGEALIRNFLIGDQLCKDIGGKVSAGYVPDNFGHISQLPQILQGVGIDTAMFFRGMDLERVGSKEFWWQAPDGSRVLGEYMLLGYWSLKSWGRMEESVVEHFRRAHNTLAQSSRLQCTLLINGSDHLLQDPEFANNLEQVSKAFPDLEIRDGSFEDYGRLLWQQWEEQKTSLPVVYGELRDFRYGPDPTAVTSCRSYLKRKLFQAIREISRYAEPFYALLSEAEVTYPQGIFTKAWKDLLKALGHDGVTGCSSDAVEKDIESYIDHSFQAASRLVELAFEKIDLSLEGKEGQLLIFNPGLFAYSGIIETVVAIEDEKAKDFCLYDPSGELVEWEYVRQWSDVITREFPYNSKERIRRQCFLIRFKVKDLSPLGISCFRFCHSPLREMRQKEWVTRLMPSQNFIENEYYRIDVLADASLRVFVKRTGKTYEGLNRLISRGEAGDEYQHVSPLADEHTFPVLRGYSLEQNSVLSSTLRIRGELGLPVKAKSDYLERDSRRSICDFETVVTLYQDCPRIEFKTSFNNQAVDHILSATFPTDFREAKVFSQMAFDHVERDGQLFSFREELKSTQSLLQPLEQYAGLSQDESVLALTTRGIYEFQTKEHLQGTCLYLTLLRSTSWLFHGLPLNYQDGQHSTTPLVETMDSRELGQATFEYALLLDYSDLKTEAEAYRYPPRAFTRQASGGSAPLTNLPKIHVSDPRLAISCFKKAEQDGDLLLRLYNTSDEAFSFEIRCEGNFNQVSSCNLLEEEIASFPICDGIFHGQTEARKIITYKIGRR